MSKHKGNRPTPPKGAVVLAWVFVGVIVAVAAGHADSVRELLAAVLGVVALVVLAVVVDQAVTDAVLADVDRAMRRPLDADVKATAPRTAPSWPASSDHHAAWCGLCATGPAVVDGLCAACLPIVELRNDAVRARQLARRVHPAGQVDDQVVVELRRRA